MTLRIASIALIAVLGIVSAPLLTPVISTGAVFAGAEDAWKTEMDLVCSRTQDAMSMSTEELKSLVARCDRLKPIIEGLEETMSKVFGKRLQMCRDLYAFMIDSRTSEAAKQ